MDDEESEKFYHLTRKKTWAILQSAQLLPNKYRFNELLGR